MKSFSMILLAIFCQLPFAAAQKAPDPYYKEQPLFLPAPKANSTKPWNVKNFGPVGIGLDLHGTGKGFKMVITNVEPGSPAAATNKLKPKQVITSINGQVLKDRDPRMILGDLITEAEAKDGKIALNIEGVGEVVVQIPVLGSYSPTWPLDCAKSDKVVRRLADHLATFDKPSTGAALFLLSTGEEKDLEVVRKWMSKMDLLPERFQWGVGLNGMGVCEYYLRTGDKTVLPIIESGVKNLRETMFNGGWSGRGIANFTYSTGSGQLSAAGIHCLSFLMLAKMCGVEVDDYMLQRATRNFFRHGGRGSVPYGDGWPEGGFRDNGKHGALALSMAIAARLDPKGESSIYAKARDNAAMKSFYGTNWFHSAHTGGGLGEIWHNTAMSLVKEKRPVQYRSYLDTRRWVMDLSKRHTGGIGIAGLTDRYDKAAGERGNDPDWGTFFALTYTLPRKTLQLSGAAPTQWCKTAPLPVRPWGNAADDIFQSIEPAKHPSISMADLLKETVENDASVAVFKRIPPQGEVSDEMLLKYLHHPEYALRQSAAARVVAHNRSHIVMYLLKADDPRLRQAGLATLSGKTKDSILAGATSEMYDLAGRMLADPEESWWVKVCAAKALANADPELIARYKEPLMVMLKDEHWWLSASTFKPLGVLGATPEYHRQVLPALIDAISRSEASPGVSGIYALNKALAGADKEVQAFAGKHMADVYLTIPKNMNEPSNGALLPGKATYVKFAMSYGMAKLPGTEDFVMTLPKMTLESKRSGRDEDMYVYNGTFTLNEEVMNTTWIPFMRESDGSDEAILEAFNKLKQRAQKNPKNRKKVTDSLLFLKGGRLKGGNKLKHFAKDAFWSGEYVIGKNNRQEAWRLKVRTIGGLRYLLMENGGFSATPDQQAEQAEGGDESGGESTPEDLKNWHCGYRVFVEMNEVIYLPPVDPKAKKAQKKK